MKVKLRWDRNLAFWVLIFTVLMAGIIPIEASDIREELESYREEQQQLEQSKEETQQKLEETKQEKRTVEIRLNQIDSELNEKERELRALRQDIEKTEQEIDETTIELEETQTELEEKEDFLATRMRSSYKQGNVTYLQVLFDSESFIDFLSRFTYIKSIVERDVELVEEVEKQRDIIQAQKDELEENKRHLSALVDDAEAKKAEIQDRKEEQQRLYALREQQIEEYEQQQARLEEESNQVENMIYELQAELRQEDGGIVTPLEWPVRGFGSRWITSRFGYRTDPFGRGNTTWHGGLDIGIPRTHWPQSHSHNGQPAYIQAAENGVVIFSGVLGSVSSGYGRFIIVDHGGGYTTLYAHNYRNLVSEGQSVSRGQNLAIVGSTGNSTGPHLHFEVRENGERENPLNYLE